MTRAGIFLLTMLTSCAEAPNPTPTPQTAPAETTRPAATLVATSAPSTTSNPWQHPDKKEETTPSEKAPKKKNPSSDFGLGLRGAGIGGGGTGEGTISICGGCDDNKIGPGGGGGDGSGLGPKGAKSPVSSGPNVVDGKATITGGIDKDIMRRVIHRAMPSIKLCYEQALAKKPSLGGKVVIEFTINTSGAVTSSTATKGIDPEVDSCVAQKISTLVFPPPSSESKVSYPFVFINIPE